jgi:hypothetical protein
MYILFGNDNDRIRTMTFADSSVWWHFNQTNQNVLYLERDQNIGFIDDKVYWLYQWYDDRQQL